MLSNYETFGCKIAGDFSFKIDPIQHNLPNYLDYIKKPMDLATISTNLNTGKYDSLEAFHADGKLVFKNAIKYN
eukprot:jgi/Bigna1/41623/e_gw1.54.102.1